MGIFGDSPQAQVDLDDLKERVTKLEAAMSSLQARVEGLAAREPGSAATSSAPEGSSLLDSEWLGQVRDLKRDGNLIGAIKLYREHTGLGLKEAKDAVEAMP